MPPWPSLSRLVRQRMFLFAATLHVVGAPSTFTRNVPSGPPACGQPATVTGAPVSGTALSPTLTSAASFSAVTLPTLASEASVAGTLPSGFGSRPCPGPLSALGVAPSGLPLGPPLGVALGGAVEHAPSRQHNAARHPKNCSFFAVIIISIDRQRFRSARRRAGWLPNPPPTKNSPPADGAPLHSASKASVCGPLSPVAVTASS